MAACPRGLRIASLGINYDLSPENTAVINLSWVYHANASILGSRLANLHPPISFLFSKHVTYWNSSGLQSFTLWSKDLTLWGVLLLKSDNLWLQFMTLGMVNHHRVIHSDYSIHFCRSHLSCGLFWTEPQPTTNVQAKLFWEPWWSH